MVAKLFANGKSQKNEISSIRSVAGLESVGVSVLMVGIVVYGVTVGRHQIWVPSNSHLVEKNTKKKHGSGTVWQILGGFPGFQYSLSLKIYFLVAAFFWGEWGPKPVVVSSGDEGRHLAIPKTRPPW